jgi:hypothetical protein
MAFDRAEVEQHTVRIGGGLDGIYVRRFQVNSIGVSALDTRGQWQSLAGLDDLFSRGRKDRRRWPVGPGAFVVGDAQARSLGRDGVLVLGVDLERFSGPRAVLVYGELLSGGKAVARWSRAKQEWRYVDKSATGRVLAIAPVEVLGPVATAPLGPRLRPSALT